jgi:2-polyprenyl-3-methyl-5-hydroxy-6-metoxy-1,4-benzoquinol methylase
MTPYQEEANLGVLRHVHGSDRILDIGCGRGRLGMEMKKRGNTVHGVEIDPDAAEVARSRLDFVFCGDATDHDALPSEIRQGNYDCIVFADVLEHVPDPERLLSASHRLLEPHGRIIVSLPNVAVWTMRLRLLLGDFTYGSSGVLDRTHLRFFTRKTARRLLVDNGFSVTEEDLTPSFVRTALPVVSMVLRSREQPQAIVDSKMYSHYRKFVEPLEVGVARVWPALFAFQHILVGTKVQGQNNASR